MRPSKEILDQAREKIKEAPRPTRPSLYFTFLLLEALIDIRDILKLLPKDYHL